MSIKRKISPFLRPHAVWQFISSFNIARTTLLHGDPFRSCDATTRCSAPDGLGLISFALRLTPRLARRYAQTRVQLLLILARPHHIVELLVRRHLAPTFAGRASDLLRCHLLVGAAFHQILPKLVQEDEKWIGGLGLGVIRIVDTFRVCLLVLFSSHSGSFGRKFWNNRNICIQKIWNFATNFRKIHFC